MGDGGTLQFPDKKILLACPISYYVLCMSHRAFYDNYCIYLFYENSILVVLACLIIYNQMNYT